MQHITFPSINQFKNLIVSARKSAEWHQIGYPTIRFEVTIKGHGTNSGICRPINGSVDDIWYQSRERVITPEQDNAGFAMWAHGNRETFNNIFDAIRDQETSIENDTRIIQIFGEFLGSNIQKGVGVNGLPKFMNVFGIRVSNDAESSDWKPKALYNEIFQDVSMLNSLGIYHKYQFKHWYVDIDFNDPKAIQNQLIEWCEAIENDCPIARHFLPESTDILIGEGMVLQAIPQDVGFDVSSYMMKIKGEKHSASKVKTIAPVDTEKLNSIKEFVEYAVTENRLNQGIDKLREMGLPNDSSSTGAFIKWVMGDVLKEELDVVAKSGLTTKEITGPIANKARDFFMKQL